MSEETITIVVSHTVRHGDYPYTYHYGSLQGFKVKREGSIERNPRTEKLKIGMNIEQNLS